MNPLCSRCGKRRTPNDLCYQCRGILKRNPDADLRPFQVGVGSMTIEERFWSKVEKRGPDECWPWLAHKDRDGYGRFVFEGSDKGAHRFAYELIKGPIPEGKQIDHTCHNESDCELGKQCPHRPCCNPAHLIIATSKENIRRGKGLAAKNADKTHCDRGHEFTPENTIIQRYPDGHYKGRDCRICKNERNLRAYHKKKEAL